MKKLATATVLAVFALATAFSVARADQTFTPIPGKADTILLAQRSNQIQGGSGTLVAPGKDARKDCNGQSVEDCCQGIDYCACLHNPMGGGPLSCFSSPPSGGSSGG